MLVLKKTLEVIWSTCLLPTPHPFIGKQNSWNCSKPCSQGVSKPGLVLRMADSLLPLNREACKWVSQPFQQPGLLSSSEVEQDCCGSVVICQLNPLPAQGDPMARVFKSWKFSRVGICFAHRAAWSVLATGFSPCITRGKLTFHPLRTNVTRILSFSSSSLNSVNRCSPGDRVTAIGGNHSACIDLTGVYITLQIKEPQKDFSFAGALPTSFSVKERKNKEGWVFLMWPVHLASQWWGTWIFVLGLRSWHSRMVLNVLCYSLFVVGKTS